MKETIAKALEVFRRYPDATHEQTVEHLTSAVGDAELAERLMEFVPIAFARLALADTGVTFQDKFCRSLGDGKLSHYCPLSAEPLWEPATALAREEQSGKIPEADRLAVLSRSALFNTIQNARDAGEDLRGAVMSASVFLRPAPMPCEPKPWWQFWK